MASKSNSSRKKPTQNKKKETESGFLKDEIIILISLALCILLVISNFGLGGFIGDGVSSVLFGVFGFLAYIAPVLIFAGIAFCVSNRGNTLAYIKTAAGVMLMLTLCTLLQLITVPFDKNTEILEYYRQAKMHRDAGGIIGGAIARVLCPAVGIVGTYVIVIVMMIICMVIITEKSLLGSVKSKSQKAYESAREDAARRREVSARKKEEQRAVREERDQEKRQRKDHQVSGVSFDTTLKQKSPEMREITMPQEPVMEAPQAASQEAAQDLVINRAVPQSEEPSQEIPAEQPPQTRRARRTKESAKETVQEVAQVASEIQKSESKTGTQYQLPPLSLLKKGKRGAGDSDAYLRETANKLQQTLENFGVHVTVTNVSCGPSVTRYELQPEQGVKVSKIVSLTDDIKLNLAAADIRMEAPIPGKAAIGIEVPNKETSAVMLRDLLESEEFKNHPSKIAFAAGKDISGQVVVADIAKMPHLLIAGATGSGKSVCINTLIMSILYKASPEEVKLIMVDPKVVELSVYNGIPHLMIPVVTDPKKASGALNWAVAEMTRRYQLFAEYNVRDIKGYNEKIKNIEDIEDENKPQKMPQIVIIVDELADLMMVAPGEVEEAICRLAQLARAAGIHLVLATQRPSVNVITGLIKANMPSRIAFSVSSGVDSRTIIDMNGAEKLLGKGDMLFYPSGYQKPARVQGAFVSDPEVQAVVDYLVQNNGNVTYSEEIENHVNSCASGAGAAVAGAVSAENDRDAYFVEAGKFIIEKDKASIGMLQRVFKIGFNRAARIMDQLYEAGVVGEEEGTKPRKVLMSMEEFEAYIEEYI